MKKVKNVWLRCSAWLLNSILLLLGFSSCDSNGSEMYGTPYATYSLKGKVVDAQNQPIPDIEVKIKIGRGGDYHSQIAPLKTNSSGEFAFKSIALIAFCEFVALAISKLNVFFSSSVSPNILMILQGR